MSDKEKPEIGSITWCDLTIKDAEIVKDFYSQVVGWKPEAVTMGEYNDYSMVAPESDKVAAGVCHARGVNAKLPPQWLIYITVKDVMKSAELCEDLGGEVIVPVKKISNYGTFCVIKDPAGAVCALFQPD